MTELAEPQSRAGNHGRVEGEPQKPGTMHGADRCEADSKWLALEPYRCALIVRSGGGKIARSNVGKHEMF